MVVPYRHRLMMACHMVDGKKHPSLLTKNVDRAGINPLMSLPSQSCDRGLHQIISTPLSTSLQSCSGGTSADANPVQPPCQRHPVHNLQIITHYYYLIRSLLNASPKIIIRWIGPLEVINWFSKSLNKVKPIGNWCKKPCSFCTVVNKLWKVASTMKVYLIN